MYLPYRKKLWTPILNFGGGTTGITYTFQFGEYYQESQGTRVNFQIQLSSKGSSTGNAGLNFPFTFFQLGVVTYNYAATILASSMNTITGIVQLVGTSNTNTCFFIQLASGTPSILTDANFRNTSYLQCSFLFMPLQP